MSDHKHTRRWRVAVEKTTVGEFGWTWASVIYRHDRDWGVLSIPTGEMSKVQPPPHPDALLIAAAPALRDALEGLLTHVGVFSSDSKDGDRVRAKAIAALALADGQEEAS